MTVNNISLFFPGNTCEMKLVSQIFEFVRGIAELDLTETALALYSAYILLQHGKFYCANIIRVHSGGGSRKLSRG